MKVESFNTYQLGMTLVNSRCLLSVCLFKCMSLRVFVCLCDMVPEVQAHDNNLTRDDSVE